MITFIAVNYIDETMMKTENLTLCIRVEFILLMIKKKLANSFIKLKTSKTIRV